MDPTRALFNRDECNGFSGKRPRAGQPDMARNRPQSNLKRTGYQLSFAIAPWWLNTRVLMPGSEERKMMVDETGLTDNDQEPVPRRVYEELPENVKPLFRHWISD